MRVLVIEDDDELRRVLVETVKYRLKRRVGKVDVLDGAKTADAERHLELQGDFNVSILDVVLLEKGTGDYGRAIDPNTYEGVAIYNTNEKRLGKVIFITNSATLRNLRKLWPEIDKMTVCLKDPPPGTPESEDWPENLYGAIQSAAGPNKPKKVPE
jgi:hypothetical protein